MKWTGNRIEIKDTLLRQPRLNSLIITGATVETGSGDKSPDNPYTLSGTTALTVSDGGNQSQTIALPQPLYSLPDGTADSYDVVSGSGTQRVGKLVMNGGVSEKYSVAPFETTTDYAAFSNPLTHNLFTRGSPMYCDKLLVLSYYNFSTATQECISNGGAYRNICIKIAKSRLSGWSDTWTNAQKVSALKSWLAANPVTVLYQLATPKAISGEAQTIPTYYPYTQIINDAGGE